MMNFDKTPMLYPAPPDGPAVTYSPFTVTISAKEYRDLIEDLVRKQHRCDELGDKLYDMEKERDERENSYTYAAKKVCDYDELESKYTQTLAELADAKEKLTRYEHGALETARSAVDAQQELRDALRELRDTKAELQDADEQLERKNRLLEDNSEILKRHSAFFTRFHLIDLIYQDFLAGKADDWYESPMIESVFKLPEKRKEEPHAEAEEA